MSDSTDDKNEGVSEHKTAPPERRADGERRCEIRKDYINREYRDNIPRRMSDFSEIMLDDN